MWTFKTTNRARAVIVLALTIQTFDTSAAQAADPKAPPPPPPPGAQTIPLGFAGWDNGFFVRSPDGAFTLKLKGYVHADTRTFPEEQNDANQDTFTIRRARPIMEGTVYKFVDFRIMPDFGGGQTVLQDAWADVKYVPQASVRAGKFKTPFGIERLRSATAINFVERALPDNLVPNRDLGFEVHNAADSPWGYSLAVLNGVLDGGSSDADLSDSKDAAGRLFVQPWLKSDNKTLQNFGLGIAGTYGQEFGQQTSTNLPTYRTSGRTAIFRYSAADTTAGLQAVEADGDRWRFSPQGYWYTGPFGLLWEYDFSSQDVKRGATDATIENQGWQINGSWMLTGEANSYKGVKVATPVSLEQHTWGGWELSARYSALYIDDDAFDGNFASRTASVSQADAVGLSLNWHLNNSLKFVTNYEATWFKDGAADGDDRDTEHILFMRVQFAI